MYVGVCILEEERTWWRRECVSFANGKERKKMSESKIIKILNARAIVTTLVHLCTILHPLMWVFFLLKMCKISYFFYFAKLYTYWWDALMPWSNQSTEVFFYLLQFQMRPQICKYPNNKISNWREYLIILNCIYTFLFYANKSTYFTFSF